MNTIGRPAFMQMTHIEGNHKAEDISVQLRDMTSNTDTDDDHDHNQLLTIGMTRPTSTHVRPATEQMMNIEGQQAADGISIQSRNTTKGTHLHDNYIQPQLAEEVYRPATLLKNTLDKPTLNQ